MAHAGILPLLSPASRDHLANSVPSRVAGEYRMKPRDFGDRAQLALGQSLRISKATTDSRRPARGCPGLASQVRECESVAGPRKPSAAQFEGAPSAERACHSCRLFTSSPRLVKSALTSSASTAAAPAAMVVK